MPEAAHVRLVAYDVLGREMAVLVDETLAAGRHEAAFEASRLPSGVYVVRMEASRQVFTRRLMLVK